MDLTQLASNPSDPAWEEPRFHSLHTIRPFSTDREGSQDGHDLSERAKTLDHISMEFQRLVAKNVPLNEVEEFTRQWEVTSVGNTPVVQPNLLAWFSDTNALRLACANDNQDVIRFLLQMGLSITPSAIVYATSKLRETNDNTVLELLLDFGWDINKPLGDTRPPLLSSLVDIPDLVLWCLRKGADPSLSSPSGLSIIEQAASVASLNTIELLVERAGSSRNGAPVARASYSHAIGSKPDRVEVARYLLDQGYSVDALYKAHKESSGDACENMMIGSQNALHFAIWSGKEDMVRLLLERGADKTLPTRSIMKTEGRVLSPSELARKFGHTNIAALLRGTDEAGNG
ncbi:ankyrin repeat-containing domain protein [Xylaria scruposa]|nr:ankyrin repeat-containing domain protein [Xylaria scruposa]